MNMVIRFRRSTLVVLSIPNMTVNFNCSFPADNVSRGIVARRSSQNLIFKYCFAICHGSEISSPVEGLIYVVLKVISISNQNKISINELIAK